MLHEVIAYGQCHGIAGRAGFTSKAVRWLITFDQHGQLIGVVPAEQNDKGKPQPRILPEVPHLQFSGDTPMRQFLVDTAQYALLYDADASDPKLLRKHQFFLHLLRAGAQAEPILSTIADAIADNSIRQRICDALASQSPKAKSSDNITFAVVGSDGARVIAAENTWHAWWQSYFPTLREKKSRRGKNATTEPTDNRMRCFLSGELAEPALTHPKIKGLGDVGGKAETTLVGFNPDAFRSFGLEQSANAAISDDMAQHYAASLNHLIANQSKKLAGAKVVYWYIGDVHIDEGEDVLGAIIDPELLGISADDDDADERDAEVDTSAAKALLEGQAVNRARMLLEAIQTGQRAQRLGSVRYCAMALSGNAGRVVVRDWMEGSFESLAKNVHAWFNDLSIISRDGARIIDAHKLNAILAAPVRELSDAAAPLVTALWQCAVHNLPIPHEIMARTLARVRLDVINDEPPRHARLGLLKAYCNRHGELPLMTPDLNEDLKTPAYLCGRIMALLADIQRAALGDVGAGVVQRYYAAASAAPGLVLGRLIRLAQTGHLPKIEPDKLRYWFDQQLTEIWARLEQRPPATLTLEEQTLFAMGYYHQKAHRPSKATSNSNAAGEAAT